MLAAIVEGRLYEGTYEANLFGCQVEMKALARLLQAQRPALAEHLARIGCEMCFLSTDWWVQSHDKKLQRVNDRQLWHASTCAVMIYSIINSEVL